MSPEHALLPVIDKIYAAAAREIALDDALRSFASLMGDFVAAMFIHDPMVGNSEIVSDAAFGIERSWLEFYNRRFSTNNPLIQLGIVDLMAGRIVNTEDLMPWRQVMKTDYYNEFLQPLGVRYSLGALITGQAQRFGSLITARTEQAGPYTTQLIGFVEAIRPHVARALHILEFFEGSELSLLLFRNAMDQLPFSVLLLDNDRRVIYANARAQRRLQDGDGICELRGRFAVAGLDRDAFDCSWAELVASELSSEGRFSARGTEDVPPLRIEVTRILVPGALINSGRMWMVRLSDHSIERRHLLSDWKARFNLTAAECKVGLSLLEYGDAVSVAGALSLSKETVRAHLKTMFLKTASKSQAALVLRLAMGSRIIN